MAYTSRGEDITQDTCSELDFEGAEDSFFIMLPMLKNHRDEIA